jgi:hypothetical protein
LKTLSSQQKVNFSGKKVRSTSTLFLKKCDLAFASFDNKGNLIEKSENQG